MTSVNRKITANLLSKLGVSTEDKKVFQQAFPEGEDYQELLDYCAVNGMYEFGLWLLRAIGPTGDVRVYKTPVVTVKPILFAGGLVFWSDVAAENVASGGCVYVRGRTMVEGDMIVGGGLDASVGLSIGGNLEVGTHLKTDKEVIARGYIKTGGNLLAGMIDVGGDVVTGKDIRVSQDVNVGAGVKARDIAVGGLLTTQGGIQATEYINAGKGVSAGANLMPEEWPKYAIVTAKKRPENLLSGHWVQAKG